MMKNKKIWFITLILIIIVGVFFLGKKDTNNFLGYQKDYIISGTILSPEGEELLYNNFEILTTTDLEETQQILEYRKNFEEQYYYTPGTYIVKFNDDQKNQYLQEFLGSEERNFTDHIKKHNNNETTRKALDILQTLDQDFKLLSITRPKLRFHNPEETGVYWNNYYYVTFEKRYKNDNREKDEILNTIETIPNTQYVSTKTTMRQLQSQNYPNDPNTNQMRYLNKTDTYDAREAINFASDGNAKVGLIEGVNSNHEDLVANIHQNVSGGPTSHGTHTAGSVVAHTNNAKGVAAISNNNAKLIIRPGGGANCPYCWDSALDGVVSRGAQIVSVSQLAGFWLLNSAAAQNLTDIFNGHNQVLFLVAAGNENLNPETDYARNGYQYCCGPRDPAYNAAPGTWGIYPGAVTSPNVMTVAASTPSDAKASFSCYGGRIDITSPGTDILSTDVSGYSKKSGTSMATPIAASLAGLLKGLKPNLSAQEIQDVIKNTADPISRQGGAGRINVCNAVNAIGFPCPFAPESDCSDGQDNNGDGKIDCADPSCGVTTTLEDINTCGSSVTLDATTQGASSYLRQPGGETTATITVNPSQTTTYSVDIQKTNGCNATLKATVVVTDPEPEQCNDNIDNNCNGQIDCADSACAGSSSCSGGGGGGGGGGPGGIQLRSDVCNNAGCDRDSDGETNCLDGIDNDRNGQTDCQDSNCKCFGFCGGYTCNGSDTCECNCCDGIDNNGDGKIDCLEKGQIGANGVPSEGQDPSCECDLIGSLAHDNFDIPYNPIQTDPFEFLY